MPESARKPKICVVTHSYPRFAGDWHASFIEKLAEAYAKRADVTVFIPFVSTWQRQEVEKGVRLRPFCYLPVKSWHIIGNEALMHKDLTFKLIYVLLIPIMMMVAVV